MLVWYAYPMDVQAYEFGFTLIAPGCKGSIADGSCSFDELLKYLQRSGHEWTGSTTVGQKLNPEVGSTAAELSASGYKCNFEPLKLFTNNILPTQTNFPTMFGQVVDNIQECRKKFTDAALTDGLTKARYAMTCMQRARFADQSENLIKDLNQQLASKGATWVRISSTSTLFSSVICY